MKQKTTLLMILDGFGLGSPGPGNAISLAKTPHLDNLWRHAPYTEILASGDAVGLPKGQMGNSEVGHLNLGAGRVVYQELTRITNAIEDGSFFTNSVLVDAMKAARRGHSLHLMGLVSDGGVHSHLDHLKGLLRMAKNDGVSDVFVHAFLDGRDVPPQSALTYLNDLEEFMVQEGVGQIATVSGRFYAMDRDQRWNRSELAFNAMVYGQGQEGRTAVQVVKDSYEAGVTDEFVIPTVLTNHGEPIATIKDEDVVIFFNFRPDRARQLTCAMTEENFEDFPRYPFPTMKFVTMTQYDARFSGVQVAFANEVPKNTLGEYLSNQGLTQLRTAETEKYPHVTFFFNGGREMPYPGEGRYLVPSPKVATYDEKPEMSAVEVTDYVVSAIRQQKYDFIVLNYANCDMVGHTGNIEATVKAVETVDACVGRVLGAMKEVHGMTVITADHGNADYMLDDIGQMVTSHSTAPVPLWVVGADSITLKPGRLADVAPTILELMNLEKPVEMTGDSLLKED